MNTWTKTPAGYEMAGHKLSRAGRVWTLTLANGSAHRLGKRASFDAAEAIIAAT